MASSRLKTTTFASGTGVGTGIAVALAVAMAVAGCDDVDCPPNSTAMATTSLECTSWGSVQVASPTLTLPTTAVPGIGATTCKTGNSMCAGESVIAFASPGQGGDGDIHFGLRIAATDGPGTYQLTGDTTRFGPALASDGVSYTGDLAVTSGTLVITRNNADDLIATFAVELQTTDGQHRVSLTNGSIHVGDCAFVNRTTCWVAD